MRRMPDLAAFVRFCRFGSRRRARLRPLVAFAALLVAWPLAAQSPDRAQRPTVPPAREPAAELHDRTAAALGEWLRGSHIAPSDIGLVAVPVDGGIPLLSHDAGQPFNPASTMKILTTLAGFSILGPDYRWRTTAHLGGTIEAGVLGGDLVLRGGGDPKLVVEDLTAYVARMRKAGLREIRGDLVLDDALFDVGPDSVERFDTDLSQPYNVRPHALLMNFKSTRLVAAPGAGGARLRLDPSLADVAIEDRVRLVRGPCRAGGVNLSVADSGPGQQPAIRVLGTYAPACGEQSLFVSVLSHRQYIHALFRSVWLASGGLWSGTTRIAPGAARGLPVWQEWVSPRTLADVVRDINKFSNNVMARQLLLMLAADPERRPVTLERARDAVGRWLASQGLDLPGAVIDNGSGLSRHERLSAASLAQLLQFAAAGPHADRLRESLPQVGVDGTMKRRLEGEPVASRAWIKTGSLVDVRAIAGYVDAASGRRYAVALLINGPRLERARMVQDRFLRWVHDNG
jgi:D-alanyl-D-alanine carboxypeptidase/D-alanyl-D-alanine-endopeptidase (penicillin-binding protein 4)